MSSPVGSSSNDNPFAPPAASLDDDGPVITTENDPPFFSVSVTKLVVMSLCTFTLYDVYWFYKNWKRIKEREKSKIVPWARALFTVFYCYPCFKKILDYGDRIKQRRVLPAAELATGWIITTLISRAPEPYSLLAFFSIAFLVPVQIHVNRINEAVAPDHPRNDHFTAWNWILIILGGLLLILAFLGAFLPDQFVGE